jgi:hypothetical protein
MMNLIAKYSWPKDVAEWELGVLSTHLNVVENLFKESLESNLRKIAEDNPSTGDPEEDAVASWKEDDLMESYAQNLITPFRYSCVVLEFIVFEHLLLGFCDELQAIRGISISLKDFRKKRRPKSHGNIDAACLYLREQANIDVKAIDGWQKIQDLKKSSRLHSSL